MELGSASAFEGAGLATRDALGNIVGCEEVLELGTLLGCNVGVIDGFLLGCKLIAIDGWEDVKDIVGFELGDGFGCCV